MPACNRHAIGLDVVSDRHDRDVFVFPNAHPVRGRFQFRVRRVRARHARAGELHAARMQDEPATVDQERVAVQRITRHLATFRAVTTFDGRAIQIGEALAERARAEQVGRIDQCRQSCPHATAAVIHDDAPALERADLRFTLAVRDEVNQVQLPQRGFRCRVHRHGHQPVATVTSCCVASTKVAPFSRVAAVCAGHGFTVNRQQVARHGRRREHALEARK